MDNPLIFRFDDISGNTDFCNLKKLTRVLVERCPGSTSMFCLNPIYDCLDSDDQPGRVFRNRKDRLNRKDFFNTENCFIPGTPNHIRFSSHGLIHVNHILLSHDAQEMSILTSCHLLKTKVFVPPFNGWDFNTEKICKDNGIFLVKSCDGWLSVEHNKWDECHQLWYLHPWRWTSEKLEMWFEGNNPPT